MDRYIRNKEKRDDQILEKVVIFGAGAWGDIAYHYCKKKYEIIAYVDNNSTLWNTSLNEIPVKSPDILKNNKVKVVLANLKGEKKIKEQLFKEYGITSVLKFRVACGFEQTEEPDQNDTNEKELIISYYGGLGNQMFIYAVYRFFENQGKTVRADMLHYYTVSPREFELTEVFPDTKIRKGSSHNLENYRIIAPYMNDERNFIYYIEPNVMNDVKSFANKRLLDNSLKWGYLNGYFQTRVFAQEIEEILRKEFVFCQPKDSKLQDMIKKMKAEKSVAVHVRRGDYLYLPEMYGGICTKDYYLKAIDRIKTRIEKPIFYFFSDDIQWVKNNIYEGNAVYIEPQMFEDYHNWYDMYLMSECQHNIIANSSFSWWGAWLNKNKKKVVIAPKKWVNADSMEDICPEKWIRI